MRKDTMLLMGLLAGLCLGLVALHYELKQSQEAVGLVREELGRVSARIADLPAYRIDLGDASGGAVTGLTEAQLQDAVARALQTALAKTPLTQNAAQAGVKPNAVAYSDKRVPEGFTRASDFLDEAVRQGYWGAEQKRQFEALVEDLGGQEMHVLNSRLSQAINTGALDVDAGALLPGGL